MQSVSQTSVNRMIDGVEAGLAANIQPVKMRWILLSRVILVDLDEGIGLRRLRRGARVAGLRRDAQRAELHRLVDIDVERDDAPVILSSPENTAMGFEILSSAWTAGAVAPSVAPRERHQADNA